MDEARISLTCPHCGAQGHVDVPVAATVLIGPCPYCGGLVAVFGGVGLGLNKAIMLHGTSTEKRRHLHEVLGGSLDQRIGQVVQELETTGLGQHTHAPKLGQEHADAAAPAAPITAAEITDFVQNELLLIDNPDYFRAIFT